MKQLGVALAIAVVVLAAILLLARQQHPLNVVLVVFDTCRADHLGCYGHHDATTPVVDGLAASGILFERAYAQVPLTLPSHATLLTGTYPEYHRIRDNGGRSVPDEHVTLAEVLRDNGYTTAAFVGALPLDARFGLDQGFDVYEGDFTRANERRAEAVNSAVETWMNRQTGTGPFFIFIHYFDPHLEYTPPSPYAERFAQAPYDGEIAYADNCLAKLRSNLGRLCPPDRTLWIFTSDHGEGLWEHDEQDHGTFLYDGTIRVPLIWSCPGTIERGRRTNVIAELADLAPTTLDFLDIEVPETMQGVSLCSLLDGSDAMDKRDRSHAETYYPKLRHGCSGLRSLRTERWLYVLAPREELYDLRVDPGQSQNIFEQHPSTAASLKKTLMADVIRFRARPDAPKPITEIDPETEERLASLGYVGKTSGDVAGSGFEDSLLVGSDPKDRILLIRRVDLARRYFAERNWPLVVSEIRRAVSIEPGFFKSPRMLARAVDPHGRISEDAPVWAGLLGGASEPALVEMLEAAGFPLSLE